MTDLSPATAFRLSRLLVGYCNIYRAVATIGSDKKRGEPSYTLIAANVRYFRDDTINDNNPERIGRIKQRGFFTEDNVVMDDTVNVRSQDLIKNLKTGTISRVMGDPRVTEGTTGREIRSMYLRLMEEEHPPAGLV